MPTTTIDASPAQPNRLGLLASARIVANGTDNETANGRSVRWTGGMVWQPEACKGGEVIDPCGTDGGDTAPTLPAEREYTPFIVTAGVKCSTFGSNIDEMRARARARLIATQGRQIEAELWAGALSQAASWSNPYLADPDSTIEGGDPLGYVTALSRLEAEAAATIDGRAMIHATRQTVSLWVAEGLVQRQGDLLVTALDTLVVPGVGYDGTGPNYGPTPGYGDFAWAVVTDPVVVRLGEIVDVTAETRAGTDPATNTTILVASRFAAATFDGCLHAAALIDHSTAVAATGS